MAARALYSGTRGPSDAELEAAGLTRDDIKDSEEEILVWAENWQSLEIFCSLRTQWIAGFNGRTGINYCSLPVVFDLYNIEKNSRLKIFEDIMVMENAALGVMQKSG